MSGYTAHYVQAVDSTTGTIREECGPFVSIEDANDHADELRAKWSTPTGSVPTVVSVRTRVEDQDRR